MSRLVGLWSFVTVTIVGNALCSVGLVRALTGRLCGVYLVEAPVVLGCDVHVLAVAGAEDAAECFVARLCGTSLTFVGEVGVPQVRLLERCGAEIGAFKVGRLEPRLLEARIANVRFLQVRRGEFRLREVGVHGLERFPSNGMNGLVFCPQARAFFSSRRSA